MLGLSTKPYARFFRSQRTRVTKTALQAPYVLVMQFWLGNLRVPYLFKRRLEQ
jgi:hypothetical protein